jgi:hypothetical protein
LPPKPKECNVNNNVTIVAQTLVQLAQLGVYVYAIQSARMFLIHWLDKRSEPLFARKHAVQQAIDDLRKDPNVAGEAA